MDTGSKTGRKDKKGPKTASVTCSDPRCPVHGGLSVHGKLFEGTVVSDRMHGTIVIEFPRLEKVRKYDRFIRYTSRIKAHLPKCMKAHTGDKVQIGETRRLAKTVAFVVTEVR